MRRLVPLIKGAKLYVLQPFVPRPSVFDEALREEVRTRDQYLREIAEIFKGSAQEVRA